MLLYNCIVKNNLPYLINIPPFMVKDLNTQKMSFRKKLFLIIKSRFVSFLINRVNERAFCLLLNFLFKTDGPIEFENNKYIKTTTNSKIYFPNKRILRIFINTQTQLDRIFKEYCLDKINFKDGDTVLDCGANVGELFLSLNTKNIQTNYIGFEPDIETYNCLTLNTKNNKPSELFNVALSNKLKNKRYILIMKEAILHLLILDLKNQR